MVIHQLWHELTSCTQYLFTENEIVVAFWTCTLSWSFFVWGSFLSLFWPFYSFYPLIFSFKVYPLYIFYIFWFFDNMENLCNKERDEHITELNKSIMKYDTYCYRSITQWMVIIMTIYWPNTSLTEKIQRSIVIIIPYSNLPKGLGTIPPKGDHLKPIFLLPFPLL